MEDLGLSSSDPFRLKEITLGGDAPGLAAEVAWVTRRRSSSKRTRGRKMAPKKTQSDATRAFWEHIDQVSARVRKWPAWKRGGWCPAIHEGESQTEVLLSNTVQTTTQLRRSLAAARAKLREYRKWCRYWLERGPDPAAIRWQLRDALRGQKAPPMPKRKRHARNR